MDTVLDTLYAPEADWVRVLSFDLDAVPAESLNEFVGVRDLLKDALKVTEGDSL